MRTFALLYNLSCGTSLRAQTRLQRLRHAFRARGVELRPYCTTTPLCASAVVRAAIASDCEAVLAAGGDGTFNELLQAAMRHPDSLPIGIVPFGSGNVLSHDIGLSGDVARIAEKLVGAAPTKVPVGLLTSRVTKGATVRRFFAVAAGIGADARVICGVNPAWKKRFGIGAYYAEATRQLLFSSAPLPFFRVHFTDVQSGERREETVSQVIVERVGYFSSPLIERNGASPLLSHVFRLILFKTQNRATYIRYGLHLLARRFSGASWPISTVEVVQATSAICESLPGTSGTDVLTEVDGEPVGGLPAELTLIRQGIRLLLPDRNVNRIDQ
jgi:diacylglycerol kinase family enzyme